MAEQKHALCVIVTGDGIESHQLSTFTAIDGVCSHAEIERAWLTIRQHVAECRLRYGARKLDCIEIDFDGVTVLRMHPCYFDGTGQLANLRTFFAMEARRPTEAIARKPYSGAR